MNQETIPTQHRQRSRAVEFLSGVALTAIVVTATWWWLSLAATSGTGVI